MIAFFSCPQCRAKDEAVFQGPQRRGETEEQYLYRVFSAVGRAHEARGCSNRQLQIALPDEAQQKVLGAV